MSIRSAESGGTNFPDEQYAEERAGEDERDEALEFIVESGRANSKEDAERYLGHLNDLKRHIVEFLRQVAVENRIAPGRDPDYQVNYNPEALSWWEGGNAADKKSIESWLPENIDTAEPHIWRFVRTLDSNQDEEAVESERLEIQMKDNGAISIPSQGSSMASSLRKHLSPVDLALLNSEYDHELAALVEHLRDDANIIEKLRKSGYRDRAWRPILQKLEDSSREK